MREFFRSNTRSVALVVAFTLIFELSRNGPPQSTMACYFSLSIIAPGRSVFARESKESPTSDTP